MTTRTGSSRSTTTAGKPPAPCRTPRRRITPGPRASKTVSGTKTYYLYDGGEPVCEFNSSGTLIAYNVFAPDGLVARRKAAFPTWTEYTFDQQGNVAQRLDGSQSIITSSYYDAFGVENTTGTPTDQFGYNGRSGYYLDRETGLYLCQNRYFDPASGRWITRDPIGYAGGINVYGYCGSGPIGSVDRNGYDADKLAVGALEASDAALIPDTVADSVLATAEGSVDTVVDEVVDAAVDTLKREAIRQLFDLLVRLIAEKSHRTSCPESAAWSQSWVNNQFDSRGDLKGGTIDGLANDLRSGRVAAGDVAVHYVVRNGQALFVNNRSAMALTEAGIPRSNVECDR